MENSTEIDGGFILTTLIKVGAILGDEWIERAGMSGAYGEENDIAFWAGGTLQQAINLVNNPEATEDVASYVVTMGGRVIMNQALVRGKFESNINGNKIVIDPTSRSLKMFYNDTEILSIDFLAMGELMSPKIKLNFWDEGSQRIVNYSEITGRSIALYDASGQLFSEIDSRANRIFVNPDKMPNNATGLKKGTVWLNNGVWTTVME